MDEQTLAIIGIALVIAMGFSYWVLYTFLYDPNSTQPDYCNTYARQALHDTRIANKYPVNENIANGTCSIPRWDFICTDTKENRKTPSCLVARSEPKFRITGVNV